MASYFKNIITITTFLILLNSLNAYPEDIFPGRFGIGVKVENDAQHYKQFDNDAYILVFPQYRGEKLNMNYNSLSYSVIKTGEYNFELLGKSLYYGYENSDSPRLEGMKDRDASIEAGARASLKTDYGLLSLHALTDMLRNHNGQEVELRFGGLFYADKWRGRQEFNVGLFGGMRWQSKDMVDYYYGVNKSEVRNDRKEYHAGSAVIPFAGVQLNSWFSEHISVDGELKYERFPDSITNSPLTSASKNEIKAIIGLTYWF